MITKILILTTICFYYFSNPQKTLCVFYSENNSLNQKLEKSNHKTSRDHLRLSHLIFSKKNKAVEISSHPMVYNLNHDNLQNENDLQEPSQLLNVLYDSKVIYFKNHEGRKTILFDDHDYQCLPLIINNNDLQNLITAISHLLKHLPKDLSIYKRFTKVMVHFFWVQHEKNLDFLIDDSQSLVTMKVNYLFLKKEILLKNTLNSCIPQLARRIINLENFFMKETLDFLYAQEDIQIPIYKLIRSIKSIVDEKNLDAIGDLVKNSKIQNNTHS